MITQTEIDHIKNICNYYKIEKYSINDDGYIDVDDDVILSSYKLDKLPLRFNKVHGSFSCAFNNLSSLYGSPKEVGINFYATNNQLTSLQYFPVKVGGKINYTDNYKLPRRLQNIICLLDNEELLIFLKYYIHYELYDNGILNEDNYDLLMEDIKEGLR